MQLEICLGCAEILIPVFQYFNSKPYFYLILNQCCRNLPIFPNDLTHKKQ